jgi:hypothetical protein
VDRRILGGEHACGCELLLRTRGIAG